MSAAPERSASSTTVLSSRQSGAARSRLGPDRVIRALFPTRVLERARHLASGSNDRRGATAHEIEELVGRFGSEDQCRAYLERLRWPTGVRCPRCERSTQISRIETRGQFDCRSCGYQFSVRAGTILHASNVPLWKWFLAVYLMDGSGDRVSANRLGEILGVSYKTAWFIRHRVRFVMNAGKARAPYATVVGQNPHRFRDVVRRLISAESSPPVEPVATV